MFSVCLSTGGWGGPVHVVPDFATRCQQVHGGGPGPGGGGGPLVPHPGGRADGASPYPRSGGRGGVPQSQVWGP